MRWIVPIAAVAAAATLALHVAPGAAGSRAACAVPGYAYAGYASAGAVRAASATVRAERAPTVAGGHVAAWVGVGTLHGGPGGANEWLQVGIAAYRGSALRVYEELVIPGSPRRYVELARVRAAGAHRFAVVERGGGLWQASVDGRPAGAAVRLPASVGGLRAVVTAETWSPARAACNSFSFSFDRVRLGRDVELRSPVARLTAREGGFAASA